MSNSLNIEISRFTAADVDEVFAAEQVCFTSPWSRTNFTDTLDNEAYEGYVARENGELVGYVFLTLFGPDSDIATVAVMPEHRRRGIGRMLLGYALDRCRESGAEECTLYVRSKNDAAKALYESFGFELFGVRYRYYSSPEDNALMMGKDLTE